MIKISYEESKKAVLIDCTNDFNDIGLKRLTSAIDQGGLVKCYINCMGFTRAHHEGLRYHEAIKKLYSDKVNYYVEHGAYYDTFYFKLK